MTELTKGWVEIAKAVVNPIGMVVGMVLCVMWFGWDMLLVILLIAGLFPRDNPC